MQLMERQLALDENPDVLPHMLRESLARTVTKSVAEAGELAALKAALCECRQRLQRSALESTRRIVALNGSVASLEALTQSQQSQIRNLEADLALFAEQPRQGRGQKEPGRKDSAALSLYNAAEHNAAHRVWTLQKNLAAAHAEYGLLAEERDRLALQCCALSAQLDAQRGIPLPTPACDH